VPSKFGDGSGSGYSSRSCVSALRFGPPSTSSGAAGGKDEIVYNSAPTPIEASKADVIAGLFDLRMDELTRLVDEGARGGSPPVSARCRSPLSAGPTARTAGACWWPAVNRTAPGKCD
jgi:hypothetical protein